MTPKKALASLLSAFQKDQMTDDGIGIYLEKMRDIQPTLLQATVNYIIEKSRFFPTIAEIRGTAVKIAGILPPSPEEAMALLRKADVREDIYTRDGEYRYTERHWRWPEGTKVKDIGLIESMIQKVGDPVGQDGKDIFAWDRDFKRVYANHTEAAVALMLNDLSTVALPAPRKALPPMEDV